MLIYIADDEPLLLEDLEEAVCNAQPSARVKKFDWADPLLKSLESEEKGPDVAFLDIEMPGMSGMELAREIRKKSPRTRLIFVTGFTQYAVEAFSIHADGYIVKPVTTEKIKEELSSLKTVMECATVKRIRAQCFGNFEAYIDGEPIHFQYTKSRELLAYLINRRGALCTNGEILAVLWEDESGDERKKEYLKKLRNDLRIQFESKGLGNVLIQQRGLLGINVNEIDCDYYDWLDGKSEASNVYQGEYMSQYSWSEMTLGNFTDAL